jgi:molybdopterin/thiamine biosynthesis adenylyltransferase
MNNDSFYIERTDRNLGWLSVSEQHFLKSLAIGIAGCGGMGGHLAEVFLRLGVGRLVLADNEAFDTANLNRQFGARMDTLGQPKALATSQALRAIAPDSEIEIFDQGINEKNVLDFVSSCDLICDGIEFWAVGSRLLLHRFAIKKGLPVFNGNSVGFGTRLFLFTPQSAPIGEMIGLDLNDALVFQEDFLRKKADPDRVLSVLNKVIQALVPLPQEYTREGRGEGSLDYVRKRMLKQGKISALAPSVFSAVGLMSTRIILHLLDGKGVNRKIPKMPLAPDYILFDAAKCIMKTVKR